MAACVSLGPSTSFPQSEHVLQCLCSTISRNIEKAGCYRTNQEDCSRWDSGEGDSGNFCRPGMVRAVVLRNVPYWT